MANPLLDTSITGYFRAVSGIQATAQVIANRQISAPSDNFYTLQAALNIGAGRTANQLGIHGAIRTNTAYPGAINDSIQTVLQYAYANSLTMSKIVTGV